jgi:hypothetical protein
MMTMSKKSEFEAAVRDEVGAVAATSDGGGFSLLFSRLAKLWNLVDFDDLIPDELTETEVVAAVRKVWDELIVPIDIPYVPQFAETILEGMLWKVIENKIGDWFQDDEPLIGDA